MSFKNRKVSLRSADWQTEDRDGITGRFIKAGFSDTREILEMRVFDLLNIYGIDNRRACQMILMLFEFFNGNEEVDREMEAGFLRQYFSYPEWRKKHGKPCEITVGDIVLAEDINRKAVFHFYDGIVKQFYRSAEYDSREYLYLSYRDLVSETCAEEDAV